MRSRIVAAALVVTVAAVTAAAAPATATPTSAAAATGPGPTTAGGACSPAVRMLAFSDRLDKTTFDGRVVGNFSALATQRDGSVLALSDRSVLFTLDRSADRPLAAQPLADGAGAPLDSEALVVDRDRTRFVTSETEPSIRRFAPDGRVLGELPVPTELRVAPAGRATTNATFEGLALQPGGRTLVASMEGPLTGDDPGLVRFPTWTRPRPGAPFVPSAQYAFRPAPGLGVSDIAPTGDGRLLVLERSFTAGVGNTVRLVLTDPRGTADVRGVARLPADTSTMTTVPLADLGDCPTLGATARQPQRNPLLDNIEGMTVTGRGPHGTLQVLLISDDNENASQITRTYRAEVTLPRR
ncbi:esterase-like activity of phytase family protein [Pseudonocardia sediminis]|uniref:esterase-like activity of phytase family protein n=1 Tax=Pseudonocardia sediminis TaxID=1397368 RepID=UPI001A92E541|nr:esterase-like activity of phytase family protein [Pseudonocardia sediminis]